MKNKLFLLAVFALALPLAAFADNSLTFTTSGGILTGTSNGFTLTGDQLTEVSGLGYGTITGADLGSLTFTTSGLADLPGLNYAGNVIIGSPIAPGGIVTITGNGTDPAVSGLLFTGSFDQGASWTEVSQGNYTLTGIVTGTTGTGNSATGQFSFLINTAPSAGFYGSNSGASSSTTTLAVPEPGELSLLGTGMLGLMGAIRRKLKA
jgi:hypothetical protein